MAKNKQINAISRFKEQMLIVFMKRHAGEDGRLVFPISEVDDTGQYMLYMEADPEAKTITMQLTKKS